jgi:hypothetical protein
VLLGEVDEPGEPEAPELGAFGEMLLPAEPLESQSPVAERALVEPLALGLPLGVPVLPVVELESPAAEPFGPQSVRDAPPAVPDSEPEPPLMPDFAPLPLPVVPLVCAMAAPPRVNATTDAAVRRRRFIGYLRVDW